MKLGYWKLPGLQEIHPCVLQLNHAGVAFSHQGFEAKMVKGRKGMKEYGVEVAWDKSEWERAQKALSLPLVKLPYLIHSDFTATDAASVHRYIASRFAPATCPHTPEIAS
jgi:hypothetical protein